MSLPRMQIMLVGEKLPKETANPLESAIYESGLEVVPFTKTETAYEHITGCVAGIIIRRSLAPSQQNGKRDRLARMFGSSNQTFDKLDMYSAILAKAKNKVGPIGSETIPSAIVFDNPEDIRPTWIHEAGATTLDAGPPDTVHLQTSDWLENAVFSGRKEPTRWKNILPQSDVVVSPVVLHDDQVAAGNEVF